MGRGTEIPGLQDLLMLREIQNQADLGFTAMKALADGVAGKIMEEQELARNKKADEDEINRAIQVAERFNSGAGSKIGTLVPEVSYKEGKTSIGLRTIPKSDELKERRETRLADQYALNNATKLRQEFINRPEVKDFVTVNTNVSAMGKLLDSAIEKGDDPNLVGVDQGLITMYNELTDPQSVVRESEYARTPQNLPMVNRMLGAIQKVQAGGAGLTNDDRKALVEAAKIIRKERATPYNEALSEYETLAGQYGLDSTMVTRGMSRYEDVEEPQPAGAVSAEPTEQQTKYSEDDIQFTMKKHGLTRDQVLNKLQGKPDAKRLIRRNSSAW